MTSTALVAAPGSSLVRRPPAPKIRGGRVAVLTGPFGDPERTIELDEPMAIAEIIATYELAFRLPHIAVVNGEPVMRADWATRSIAVQDTLVFVMVPGGGGNSTGKQIAGLVAAIALSIAAPGIGTAVAGALFAADATAAALVSAAVLAGGSLLLNALFQRPPDSSSSQAATNVFSLSAANNQERPLETVDILYGKMRWPASRAARPYSEFIGNDQYLYQLFWITGGWASIKKIEIGDTELWNSVSGFSTSFTDVSIQIIQPGDNVTLFPANVVTSDEVSGLTVPDPPTVLGPFVLNAAGTTINKIAVDFAFPGGLFGLTTNNAITNNSAQLRAQYQQIDDAGAPIGGWSDVFRETITMATRTPQRLSRSVAVTAARYQVKFLAEAAFDGVSDNSVNAATWVGLRGYLTGFQTPADGTLLALKMKANDQLSQASASQIFVTAQRLLPIYNAMTGWSAPTETRSIAWAAADMLREATYGLALSDSVYDLAQLLALDATWSGRGDTFNTIFTSSSTASDVLTTILRAGRTQFVRMAGKVGFNRLEAKAIRRAVFSLNNIVRGSLSHKLVLFDEANPDSILAGYLDETVWTQREVLCSLDDLGSDAPVKQSYLGITNHDQMWREGVTEAAINAYQREFVSFTSEWEGKLLTRGEPILVLHPFIQGVDQAAAVSVTGLAITIDRDVTDPGGDRYLILRGKDGREWGPVLVGTAVGRVWTLDAADAATVAADMGPLVDILPDDLEERMHVLICAGETRPFNGLVVSATPGSDGKVAIVSVIDAPEVYAADGTQTMPSPWATPSLPNAIPQRPLIQGLNARLRTGVAGLELDASWLPASGAQSYIADVSYDDDGSSPSVDGTWTPLYEGATNRFTRSVLPQSLKLRVAAKGALQGPYATTTITGSDVPDKVVADGVVSLTAMADGIVPVQVVDAIVDAQTYEGAFATLTTDGVAVLYKYHAGAWGQAVPTNVLTGQVITAQIATAAITANELASAAVTNVKLAALAVATANIQLAAIDATLIANNAVTTAKINAAAVTTAQLGLGSVDATILANNAVVTAAINAVAVTTAKIASGAVTSTELGSAAVTTAKLALLSVDSTILASNAVISAKINAGAVTTAKIAAAAIDSTLLANNAVVSAAINAGAVITAKIASGAVTTTEIASATIVAGNIAAATITGAKIAAGTIAAGNILASTITTGEIAANTILAADIAAGTITATEVAAATITGAKIAATTITAGNIVAGTITTTQIAATTIVAGNIVSGTITTTQIAASTILAANIAAGTITTTQIAASTIVAGNIAAGAITTTQLAASAVTASKIAAATITARELVIGDLTNMIPDPDFVNFAGTWSDSVGANFGSILVGTGATSSRQGRFLQFPSGLTFAGNTTVAGAASTVAPVEGGHEYALGGVVFLNTGGNGNGQLVVQWLDASGSVVSFLIVGTNSTANSIGDYAIIAAAPSTAATVRFIVLRNAPSVGAAAVGAVNVWNLYLRRAASGSLIVDGAVSASKILAGTITANEIAANAITTAKIAAGAITANEIASNAVTAVKIAAGTITGDKLVASTITARELILTDFTNMLPDSDFDTFGTSGGFVWTDAIGINFSGLTVLTTSTLSRKGRALRIPAGLVSNGANNIAGALSPAMPVEPGIAYGAGGVLSMGTTATGSMTVDVLWYTNALVFLSASSVGANSTTNTAPQFDVQVTAPATAAYAILRCYGNTPTPSTASVGNRQVYNLYFRKAYGASLVVDGSITAAKIAANTITASQIAANAITAATIAAGAIGTTEIAANAITTAKLAAGAVTATEIAANAITAGKINAGAISTSSLIVDGVVITAKIAPQNAVNLVGANVTTGNRLNSSATTYSSTGNSLLGQISVDVVGYQVFVAGYVDLTTGGSGTANYSIRIVASIAGTDDKVLDEEIVSLGGSTNHRYQVKAQFLPPNGTGYIIRMECALGGTGAVNTTFNSGRLSAAVPLT